MRTLTLLAAAALAVACGSDTVDSAAQARRAYLGLDRAVDRALNLGMDGFNSASSANISPQTGNGDVAGTLTVSGQVDQGASTNKEMRLKTALKAYEDYVPVADAGVAAGGDAGAGPGTPSGLTYDTSDAALPELDLSLRNIPSGTFTGTWNGAVTMSGDLKGTITLALSMSGQIESAGGSKIRRVPGSTHVTGTAMTPYGTYAIDLIH